MLSPQRLERLRKALLEEKASLEEEVANLTATSQESTVGLGNHMADDATAAFDQATAVSLRRGHVRSLDEVNAALERMEGCECGAETSCYNCLRNYRNQFQHDFLQRGSAADSLRWLLGIHD